MPEIIPIRDLKNTNAISQRCHETQEPIFVTKSGYGDMVITVSYTHLDVYKRQAPGSKAGFCCRPKRA